MNIGLDDICLINVFLMLRFSSVGKIKTANRTKPNHIVEYENDPNTSEPNSIFCGFDLDWFDLKFFY